MNMTMLLIANLILAAQPADPGRAPNAAVLELPSCLVSLIDEVSLPAQEAGVLQEIVAKEGLRFKTGEVLGKVDETETLLRQKAAKFKLDVANEKATNDAQVKVATRDHRDGTRPNTRNRLPSTKTAAVPPSRPRSFAANGSIGRRRRWIRSRREMNFKIAGLERNVSEAELEAADNELERRTLRAPFDGVVVEMYPPSKRMGPAGGTGVAVRPHGPLADRGVRQCPRSLTRTGRRSRGGDHRDLARRRAGEDVGKDQLREPGSRLESRVPRVGGGR